MFRQFQLLTRSRAQGIPTRVYSTISATSPLHANAAPAPCGEFFGSILCSGPRITCIKANNYSSQCNTRRAFHLI